MTWYQKWFGEEYLEVYAHRSEEEARQQVEFISGKFPLKANARILDVACGAGRHVSEFAARGFFVVGIDRSFELLKGSTDGLLLLQADMRTLPFRDRSFDLLISMFTSFGYFERDEEHEDLLREWARTLKPGGHLCIDYLNRPQVIATLVSQSKRTSDNYEIVEKRRLSDKKRRIVKEIELSPKDGSPMKRFIESVRMFSLDEIERMLNKTGFEVIGVWGNFNQAAYNQESERLILKATLKR